MARPFLSFPPIWRRVAKMAASSAKGRDRQLNRQFPISSGLAVYLYRLVAKDWRIINLILSRGGWIYENFGDRF